MSESEPPTKFTKYGWLIYLVILALIISYGYFDVNYISKPSGEELDLNPEWVNEEITPLANLSCFECHSGLNGDQNITITGVDWFTSTHKEVGTTCADCHGGDEGDATIPMGSEGFIGKPEREDVPEICGDCHVEVYEIYKSSIHYSYVWDDELNTTTIASVCTDCHGIHHIETSNNPESPVFVNNRPDTCSECHEIEFYTYEDTYHSVFLKLGDELAATCSDCHGNHSVRPPSDPLSKVHPDNLPETCSIDCHENDLEIKVAQGYQHFEEDSGSSNLAFDSDDLDIKEKPYYVGPFDTRFWVPLFFNIITMVIIPSIFILIIVENVGQGIGRRLSSWKKKK